MKTLFLLLVSAAGLAGTVATNIDSAARTIVAHNTGTEPITPRLIVRGFTNGELFPAVHATGLRLGDLVLTGRMLTGATLILEPDGTGQWGYCTGFTDWVEDQTDVRHLKVAEYRSVFWDSWPPQPTRGRQHVYVLRLASGWTTRIDFPVGVRVKDFAIAGGKTGGGMTGVSQVLTVDDEAVLSEVVGNDFPHHHADLPASFLVRIGGRDAKVPHPTLGLYRVTFTATLDAGSVPRPALAPGDNLLRFTDAADSSHRWRVLLQHPALSDNPEPPPGNVPIPEHVRAHVSRFREAPKHAGAPVPLDRFFPLGVYGFAGPETLDWVVDDMVAHHCNAVYTSNNGIANLAEQVDLCDRAGLKLIHQGGSSGSLYYLNKRYSFLKNDPDRALKHNLRGFEQSAKTYLPGLRNAWGLLAWSPVEELPPDADMLRRLGQATEFIRQHDPTHPIHILHNSPATCALDLPINHPAAVTTDIYAYSMHIGSTRETRAEAVGWIAQRTAQFRQLCDQEGVPLWFMGQVWGTEPGEQYAQPPFGPTGGMRLLTPADMRMQGWVAVAAGARGVFFYVYRTGHANGYGCLDRHYRETERWQAIGDLYAELRPVLPLLLLLRPMEDLPADQLAAAGPDLLVSPFAWRDGGDAVFAVVVNTNYRESTPIRLAGALAAGDVYDAKRGRPVDLEHPPVLAPGEGTILSFGDRPDPARLAAFVAENREKYGIDFSD